MGPDERSQPGQAVPGRWGRSGRASAWAMLLWLIVPAALLAGAGCNSSLVFRERQSVVDGSAIMANGDAPRDLPATTDGGGNDTGPPDVPIDMVIDAPPDRPPDSPIDTPPDIPPDLPRADVQPDLPRDTGTDLPRDTGVVDAGGPIVCTQNSQCVLASLRCLLVAGQPGQCVECLSNTDCAGRRCDVANTHRCVECVDNTPCPTTDTSHASQCVDNHCQNGCDDSNPVCPASTAVGFSCQNVAGNQLCVDCLVPSDCTTPGRGFCINNLCRACGSASDCPMAGQMCDAITGNCVECRTSTDCKMAGLRLCDPVMLKCVASP